MLIRVAFLATLLSVSAVGAEVRVWFGTYTNPGTGSEGIYTARFDTQRGSFTEPTLAARVGNPSFLAVHPQLPMLYAVAEGSGVEGKPGGAVAAFAVDDSTGRLEPQGTESSGGSGSCHLTVDPEGKVVFAANYGGGSVACLGLTPDGRLLPLDLGSPGSVSPSDPETSRSPQAGAASRNQTDDGVCAGIIEHQGDRSGVEGINPKRQEKPHAHSVDVWPIRAGYPRRVVSCDLGLDRVFVHGYDLDKATLGPTLSVGTTPGSGPRHFAFHPDGTRGWCVNELDLTVTGFECSDRGLVSRQTLATLPASVADRSGCSGAEIAVHPSGRFVYSSNRGHDSIAMFRITAESAELEFLGTEPAQVKTPRHFAIAPGGEFLVAAGQHSGTVAVFAIDQETGRLTFTGESIAVPAPVCVLFRP